MAKTQNQSLNPTKISGTCGRLMCCLKYEQEAYEDLLRNAPKLESFVDTPDGRGTVVEVDLLRSRVKVRMEDAPETITVFANADIAILRSGKAKKNDPPIPADLAPISGSGKRVRKADKEEPVLLEPIRFRYSTEAVVEEPEIAEETTEGELTRENGEGKSRSRRRRKNKPENRKPEQSSEQAKEQPKEQPKKEQPEAAESGEEAAKKPHRRNHHRRYRKPKQSSEG